MCILHSLTLNLYFSGAIHIHSNVFIGPQHSDPFYFNTWPTQAIYKEFSCRNNRFYNSPLCFLTRLLNRNLIVIECYTFTNVIFDPLQWTMGLVLPILYCSVHHYIEFDYPTIYQCFFQINLIIINDHIEKNLPKFLKMLTLLFVFSAAQLL